jgi:putative transposase
MSSDGWDISVSPHWPLHWYSDQSCYWVTGATLYHAPHFQSDHRKRYFVEEMRQAAEAYRVELVGWTLMDHHYHAILRLEEGRSLPRFLGRLHTKTSALVNNEDRTPGRKVWRQYWDTFIRSEGDFWCRINYMWWNPVKHGFCNDPDEWPWTNLRAFVAEPAEATRTALERFPAPRKLPGDEW